MGCITFSHGIYGGRSSFLHHPLRLCCLYGIDGSTTQVRCHSTENKKLWRRCIYESLLTHTENEKKTAQALAQIYLKGQSGDPEHYRHCTAEFKLEVRQWLLVCSRLHSIGWIYLPQELRGLVIEQLFRLHHPIVTINSEGRLRGVEETMREYTKYVKEFGGRDISTEQIRV